MLTQLTHNRAQSIIDSLMSHEGHLSYSSLCAFMDTPEKFVDYKMGQKEETDAMLYGAMLHCLVLEPEDFTNRYFVLEDADIVAEIGGGNPRATKVYKAWKEEEFKKSAGKTIVEPGDYLAAKIAANAVLNNRASQKILGMCPGREIGVEWEYLNFKFKGFKDGEGNAAMFDLKSMADASPKKAQKTIIENDYHIQAAMYTCGNTFNGGTYKDYYIIAVDKKKGVSVHKLPQKLIEIGMDEYDNIMKKFNECILSDSFEQSHDFWSPRFDGIFDMEVPKWLF